MRPDWGAKCFCIDSTGPLQSQIGKLFYRQATKASVNSTRCRLRLRVFTSEGATTERFRRLSVEQSRTNLLAHRNATLRIPACSDWPCSLCPVGLCLRRLYCLLSFS